MRKRVPTPEVIGEKQTDVLNPATPTETETQEIVSRETILGGTQISKLYRLFREDGMRRGESLFNAVYLSCHNRYDESQTTIKDKYKNIMEHPRGWSGDKKKTHKRNVWSMSLACLDGVAGASRGFERVRTMVGSFFGKILRIPHGMDNSVRATKALLRGISSCILPVAAVLLAVYTVTTIASSASSRYAVGVYVDGEYAGNTESVNIILDAKHKYESDLTARYGTPIVLECDVSFRPCRFDEKTYILPGDTTVFDNYMRHFVADGYGLYVDGNLAAVTSTKKWLDDAIEDSIERQLDGYKASGTVSDEDIDRFVYNNNITMIADKYPRSYFLTRSEVRSLFSLPALASDDAAFLEKNLHFIKWEDFDRRLNENFSYTLRLDYNTLAGHEMATSESVMNIALPNQSISVELSVVRDEKERTVMPFEVEEIFDDTLYEGMRRLVRHGVDGEKLLYYKSTYRADKLLSREIAGEEILKAPINKIVRVGTMELSEEDKDSIPTGTYIYPYRGTLTSDFGWRILRGQNNFHQGLDIYGPFGDPVLASDGGEVVDVGYTRGYGKYCMIRHNESLVTRYAHCNTIDVEVGQLVSQGEQVGTLGATGNVTGVHVHFEIIVDGVTVDPLPYMFEEELPRG